MNFKNSVDINLVEINSPVIYIGMGYSTNPRQQGHVTIIGEIGSTVATFNRSQPRFSRLFNDEARRVLIEIPGYRRCSACKVVEVDT